MAQPAAALDTFPKYLLLTAERFAGRPAMRPASSCFDLARPFCDTLAQDRDAAATTAETHHR